MNREEHKRKLVIDLTNDDEVCVLLLDGKRVVISNEESDEELCDGCEGPVDPECGSYCVRCFNYTGHRNGDETSDSSDDDTASESEEEDVKCCGICGSEYETREDTADVCLECFESERNICHGCKEVVGPSELLDEDGEYCEGYCKECWPCVVDLLAPVAELIKK